MRKSFFLIFFLLISISCKKQMGVLEKRGEVSVVFNSSIEKELYKIIEISKDLDVKKTVFIVVLYQDRNTNKKIVCITLSTNIDPCKITGYTYLKRKLFVVYFLSDFKNQTLINKDKLVQYKDSIPHYSYLTKDNGIGNHDFPMLMYELIDHDSLKSVKQFVP